MLEMCIGLKDTARSNRSTFSLLLAAEWQMTASLANSKFAPLWAFALPIFQTTWSLILSNSRTQSSICLALRTWSAEALTASLFTFSVHHRPVSLLTLYLFGTYRATLPFLSVRRSTWLYGIRRFSLPFINEGIHFGPKKCPQVYKLAGTFWRYPRWWEKERRADY